MCLYSNVRRIQIDENKPEPNVIRRKAGDNWF